ncbi:MAG TPA: hypothetical protein VK004_00485 [Ignavibacteria bacterium]|nr:hypothetical protein [Ignavibacteria bacterium]
MTKYFIFLILLITGVAHSQGADSLPSFYGYVGREISPAVLNEGKVLNDFIRENEGKEVMLTIFFDKDQAANFLEWKQFTVHSDLVEKYPEVEYRIHTDADGDHYVFDPELNSLEGKFKIDRVVLMRSLVVSVALKQVEK